MYQKKTLQPSPMRHFVVFSVLDFSLSLPSNYNFEDIKFLKFLRNTPLEMEFNCVGRKVWNYFYGLPWNHIFVTYTNSIEYTGVFFQWKLNFSTLSAREICWKSFDSWKTMRRKFPRKWNTTNTIRTTRTFSLSFKRETKKKYEKPTNFLSIWEIHNLFFAVWIFFIFKLLLNKYEDWIVCTRK